MKKVFCLSFVLLSPVFFISAEEQKNSSEAGQNSDVEELIRDHTGKIDELLHRVGEIEKKLGITSSENVEIKNSDQAEEKIKGQSPESVIEIAKDFIKHDKYEDARSILNAFLKNNPKNQYCGRMLFYVGKSYFEEKNYQNAAKAYMESFEKNPNGVKTSKCLYKLSQCFMKLGKTDQMKMTLEKLYDTFSQSEYGKKAKKWLNKLNTKKS